jgi:hypothetical protein
MATAKKPKAKAKAAPKKKVEEKVEAPVEEPTASLYESAQGQLSDLNTELQAQIKKVTGDGEGETPEQVRLGAQRFLSEAVEVLKSNQEIVEQIGEAEAEATKNAQSVAAAKESIEEKSAAYRLERDAYLKLKNLSDEEFGALLVAVAKAE